MCKFLLRVSWSCIEDPTDIKEDFQFCDTVFQAQSFAKIYQDNFENGSEYCFSQVRLYKLEPIEL